MLCNATGLAADDAANVKPGYNIYISMLSKIEGNVVFFFTEMVNTPLFTFSMCFLRSDQ